MFYSVEIRREVIASKLEGKSLLSISKERGISYSTAKRIWQSYQQDGELGLCLKYANCGLKGPKDYFIFRLSTWLKRRHPTWGAPYILTLLAERYPEVCLPSARTLQKWFRTESLQQTYLIREAPNSVRIKAVHDCWQIDAKEKIELLDHTKASYLTTVDVKSGAVLDAPVFPPRSNQSSKCLRGKNLSY